jgi:GTP cyclohydrolase I
MDAVAKLAQPATAVASFVRPTHEEAMGAVRTLIAWAGDDPTREGLLETPHRVTKAYGEFFAGYEQDPAEILKKTFKEVGGYDDIVLVKDIPFFSHCEHHMVPIIGKAHIAYLPHDGVVGLSKLARLVEVFARRPQVQERLTSQIADLLMEKLTPRGVIVVLECEHMCMEMRGIRKVGARTVTSAVRGAFQSDGKVRAEAMALINAR